MLLAVRISSYGCTWEFLESTQEAKVALAYRLELLLRFLRALSPNFTRASIARYTYAKDEPILKSKFLTVQLP